ncbi:MAG: LON peptidase substrate-binding domain-containing protein, partial [Bryobacteraceae bacterium]|nr:LON peptidase substrate-binding domain-containing protein [Bryobacteraceae bacterium]
MSNALLPLFPLQVVMLPGTPMPLHIFEDRYKEMIGEAISTSTEFGIVQAGEKGILNIGCSVTVEKVVESYEDGRMDIIVRGRRRFEIVLLDEEKSYLRGSVQFFDDEEGSDAPNDLRAMAIAGLTALRSADDSEDIYIPDSRDPQLSFRVAWFITDLVLRQTLLGLRSEAERLRQLNAFLPEY